MGSVRMTSPPRLERVTMRYLPAREPEVAKLFGARVRAVREAKGILRAAFAASIDLSDGQMARIESGESFPGDRIGQIAGELSVELSDLFDAKSQHLSPEEMVIVGTLRDGQKRRANFPRYVLELVLPVITALLPKGPGHGKTDR